MFTHIETESKFSIIIYTFFENHHVNHDNLMNINLISVESAI